MDAILTIADLRPESGGPSRTVPALAEALSDLDVRVRMVALQRNGAGEMPAAEQQTKVQTTYVPCRSNIAKITGGGAFRRTVLGLCGEGKNTVLHDNGLWLGTNHGTVCAARLSGMPLMISPRGMLTEWSLQHNGWKKRIAWRLYQERDLRAASVLHATSRAEAEGFRAAGVNQPIAIVPNGVSIPALAFSPKVNGRQERILLFLSRIHPKKGLLTLVRAWAVVRPNGWKVVVAGTDEGRHLSEVKAESQKMGVAEDFNFVGEVDGDAKWKLYSNADLFVLPSHSENFGMVVAEALGCGLPVITTQDTPWEELSARRCGWWVKTMAETLADALRDATSRTDSERREMGLRGQALVEERYTWPGVAAQMKSVYEWMMKTGPKPECVID